MQPRLIGWNIVAIEDIVIARHSWCLSAVRVNVVV